ncbi:MAG: hypothetical protein CVU56_20105 [Deltaproteobacteria bacterium HGW-Deltaproteobacteria-14]|jgi:hypothetical protein|nr:MAG: hypothetical protein CVU56_20105 [Deltaproteobacteria bacterium HGW-Deltaproteobacteria-14]
MSRVPSQLWLVCALAALAACAGEGGAVGPSGRVAIAVAPLSLTGVTDARFQIEVHNGGGRLVWSKELLSSAYGPGDGSLSYVGTCDADAPSTTVTLTLLELRSGSGGASLIDPGSWRDPGPMTRTVTCVADADVAVTFDVTVARRAEQGFFDVAVSFADIFCSAKLDCTDALGDPIQLLHDGAGARGRTLVMGLACTGGAGATETTLYRDAVVLDCGTAGSVTLDPSAGPGNLAAGDGLSGATGLLFAAQVTRGREQLYEKRYWNVLLGLAPQTTACTLSNRATAAETPFAAQTTPAGTTWPVIAWGVAVTDASGALACTQHPVDGDGLHAGVATGYTGGETFTYAFTGDATMSQAPTLCADGQADCPYRDCEALKAAGASLPSGPYYVDPDGAGAGAPIPVWCDMTTDAGGWTMVARASDTNGVGNDYEFRAAAGAHSLLGTSFDVGTPADPQYTLGLAQLIPEGQLDVDLQYYCYDSRDEAGTAYWVKAENVPVDWLLADLAAANPDLHYAAPLTNRDGDTGVGSFAVFSRGTVAGGETCGNTHAGQSGMKFSCAESGQTAMTMQSVWMLTDYTNPTAFTEVTSCGPVGAASLPHYVGEVRLRLPDPPAALCAAGEQPCRFVSCKAILDSGFGTTSGTYYIDPDSAGPSGTIPVHCDMDTDGGGWTLVARASDTNGQGGDYEFAAAAGTTHSLLGASYDHGTPADAQYTLGLAKLLDDGRPTVDIQYLCYKATDAAATTYWAKAIGVNTRSLLSDLGASNPDLLYAATIRNADGWEAAGNYAFFGRYSVGTESCGNTYAGQSGMKFSCVGGQQAMNPRGVWYLTHYTGNYTEVSSCGPLGAAVMAYYVGEVRVR